MDSENDEGEHGGEDWIPPDNHSLLPASWEG